MKIICFKKEAWLLAALTGALGTTTQAADLLVNGGFESGFVDWTRADQLGSDGTFSVQSGTLSPANLFPVPAPPAGALAAMTDSFGPGSHVLYQDFFVPVSVASASIGFSLFLNNGAIDYFTEGSLDFATPALNQQVRVDLLLATADPFSLAAGDVLLNLFQTNPGDALVSGYSSYLVDVASVMQAHPGESLRLRFAEVDNVNFFNLGVDEVSLQVTNVPEASVAVVLPAMLGLAAISCGRRRRFARDDLMNGRV